MATSKTAKVLIIGGAIAVVLFLVAVIGIALIVSSVKQPSVAKNSVLILNISGQLPDYTPDDALARAVGFAQPQSFTSLLTQLRKAKVDSRVSGVFLDINFPGIGWARADELRDAIADFRTSGKPAYAYMEIGSNKEYYIATAADKIFLPPSGDIYITGFAAEAMFFKGSLDKLGIETDVIQIGPKYKNAPDQYTKTEMGDGQKEVVNALLDEFYGRFTNAIAESRKKSVEDVKALIDDAPYNARQAHELGLIDAAYYREEAYHDMKTKLGYGETEDLRVMRSGQYKEIPSDSLGLNNGEKVAVIFASGAINVGRSNDGAFGGEMVGSDTIVQAVNDAAEDKSIKAIVLRVDSPGGSALASDLMWYALENAKAKKPVVVSMGDVAASGGYYIACNANKIVAQPSTITGSIGMFMGKPVIKGMYDWLGITNQYTTRGKNSGIFKATEHWTPEEKAKMQQMADNVYFGNFLPKVAQGRGKTDEEVNTLGQGRVWTGTQAKGNGLVDEFGGLERAIQIAKELAQLPADKDVKRVVFPEPRPFFETLFDDSESAEISADQKAQKALADALPEDARRALKFAALFDQMKRGEAMLLMPFELQIK